MADLIDRAALLDDIQAAADNGGMGAIVAGTLKRYVKRAPTIDPESLRPKGEWIEGGRCNHKPHRIKNPEKWVTYKCSVCGYSNGRKQSNFCPNCGADMRGEGNG